MIHRNPVLAPQSGHFMQHQRILAQYVGRSIGDSYPLCFLRGLFASVFRAIPRPIHQPFFLLAFCTPPSWQYKHIPQKGSNIQRKIAILSKCQNLRKILMLFAFFSLTKYFCAISNKKLVYFHFMGYTVLGGV